MSNYLNDAQRSEIAQLLRAGHSAAEVSRRTGRAAWTVRKVRDDLELPSASPGRPARKGAVDDDYEQLDWPSRAKPWIPPAGYDMHAERPNQTRWLAMLTAAHPNQLERLRTVVCYVLGVPMMGSDLGMVQAAIADRRTAEELAEAYITEAGRREFVTERYRTAPKYGEADTPQAIARRRRVLCGIDDPEEGT